MNKETYHSILSAYMNAERSKLLEIASDFGPTDFPHAVMEALVQQLGTENAAPVALGIFRLLAGKDAQEART